jgi:hypothetical protein
MAVNRLLMSANQYAMLLAERCGTENCMFHACTVLFKHVAKIKRNVEGNEKLLELIFGQKQLP